MKTKTLSELKTSSIDDWIEAAPFKAIDAVRKKENQVAFIFTEHEPKDLNGNIRKTECSNFRNVKALLEDGSKRLVNGYRHGVKEYDYFITKP